MKWIVIYLVAINFLSFAITGIDKGLAVHQKWRISEKTLHVLTLAGGTIGSGLGMLLFRHKIAKTAFLLGFFGILAVQIIALLYYLN